MYLTVSLLLITILALVRMFNRQSFLVISFIFEMLSFIFEKHYQPTRCSSSTYSQFSRNNLYYSETRGRDVTISPFTFINKQKLSVTHFPSFTGNFKSVRCSFFSSGIISTYSAYMINLNNVQTLTT